MQVLKHRFIQYLFLDLASCLTANGSSHSNDAVVDTLVKFPSAFGVPPSLIKLTQAFWLVDHEDFEEVTIWTFLLTQLPRVRFPKFFLRLINGAG